MSWIATTHYGQSSGPLRELYNRVKGPGDNIDNILLVHSLRPHSMEGHMGLYKNVLHHRNNTTPKWFLETLGVYISLLNRCDYCVEHHFAGLKRLLRDEDRATKILAALRSGEFSTTFEIGHLVALQYASKLNLSPPQTVQNDVQKMRDAGWDDGGILEVNQVVAYFNYANRTVLGLGVNTDGDELGLSPSESSDPNNWSHL